MRSSQLMDDGNLTRDSYDPTALDEQENTINVASTKPRKSKVRSKSVRSQADYDLQSPVENEVTFLNGAFDTTGPNSEVNKNSKLRRTKGRSQKTRSRDVKEESFYPPNEEINKSDQEQQQQRVVVVKPFCVGNESEGESDPPDKDDKKMKRNGNAAKKGRLRDAKHFKNMYF